MARRVQCKRGQPKPPNTVLVRRPYRFGNPFAVAEYGQQGAVDRHAAWITNPEAAPIQCGKVTYCPPTPEQWAAIRGMNIGCNCDPGEPCHGDTILTIANQPTPNEDRPCAP